MFASARKKLGVCDFFPIVNSATTKSHVFGCVERMGSDPKDGYALPVTHTRVEARDGKKRQLALPTDRHFAQPRVGLRFLGYAFGAAVRAL